MSKKKKNGLNDVIETVESAIVDDKSITEIHLGSNSEIVIKRTIDSEKLDRYNEIMTKLGHRK